MPSESEIRDLVRRVVAEVVTDDPPPAAPGPTPAAPAKSIAIGADHGGYPLKERIAFRLREQGYAIELRGDHFWIADEIDSES